LAGARVVVFFGFRAGADGFFLELLAFFLAVGFFLGFARCRVVFFFAAMAEVYTGRQPVLSIIVASHGAL